MLLVWIVLLSLALSGTVAGVYVLRARAYELPIDVDTSRVSILEGDAPIPTLKLELVGRDRRTFTAFIDPRVAHSISDDILRASARARKAKKDANGVEVRT